MRDSPLVPRRAAPRVRRSYRCGQICYRDFSQGLSKHPLIRAHCLS